MLPVGNYQVRRYILLLIWLIKRIEEVHTEPILNRHPINTSTSTVSGLTSTSQQNYLYEINNPTEYVIQNEDEDTRGSLENLETSYTDTTSRYIESSPVVQTVDEIAKNRVTVDYDVTTEVTTQMSETITTINLIKDDEHNTSSENVNILLRNSFVNIAYDTDIISDNFTGTRIHELVLLDDKVKSLRYDIQNNLKDFANTLNETMGKEVMNETDENIQDLQTFLGTFKILKDYMDQNSLYQDQNYQNFNLSYVSAYEALLNDNENIHYVLEKLLTLRDEVSDVFDLHEEIRARTDEFNKVKDVFILDKNIKEKYREIEGFKSIAVSSRLLADFITLYNLEEIFCKGAATLWILNYIDWENKLDMLTTEVKKDESLLYQLNAVKLLEDKIYPAMEAIIFLVGIVANGVLLLIFIKHHEMRTAANLMLINLAIGELLSLTVSIPTSYIYYFSLSGKIDDGSCKSYTFFRYQGIGVSAYSLVAINIQRFLAMNNFFDKSKYRLGKWLKSFLYLLSAWVVGSIIAIPFTFYSGSKDGYCYVAQPGKDVEYRKVTTLLSAITFCIIPIILNSIFSGLTASRLKKSASHVPGESIGKEKLVRARVLSYRVIIVLIIIFSLSYTPYFLFNFVYSWTSITVDEISYRYMLSIFYLLIFLHSCLNPISLYVVSRKYRSYFDRYLLCRKPCNFKFGPSEPSVTTSTTALDTNV